MAVNMYTRMGKIVINLLQTERSVQLHNRVRLAYDRPISSKRIYDDDDDKIDNDDDDPVANFQCLPAKIVKIGWELTEGWYGQLNLC